MAKNKLEDLRNLLFESAERLLYKDSEEKAEEKLSVEEAKAIAGLSQQIIEGAKLEYQYLKDFGGKSSDFFPEGMDGKPRQIVGRHD